MSDARDRDYATPPTWTDVERLEAARLTVVRDLAKAWNEKHAAEERAVQAEQRVRLIGLIHVINAHGIMATLEQLPRALDEECLTCKQIAPALAGVPPNTPQEATK